MKKLLDMYCGKEATIKLSGLVVDVTVKDVKMSYGKERFLVEPVSGSGEVWVEAVTLKGI